MGTLTAQYILDKAALQLTDIDAVRWTRSELLKWLNDAQRQIVLMQPNSSNATSTIKMVAGTRQTIPSDGWLLLDAYRNMGTDGATPGRALRIMSKELLDGFNPDWHSDPPVTIVKNYLYDIQDQTAFWVYPPSNGAGYLQINYAKVPTELTLETQAIGLNDILQTVILDYILFRACSKDSDSAPGLALAQGYWAAFSASLGAKENAEAANSPNLSLVPVRGTAPGAQS
jgi:hypothetical protein